VVSCCRTGAGSRESGGCAEVLSDGSRRMLLSSRVPTMVNSVNMTANRTNGANRSRKVRAGMANGFDFGSLGEGRFAGWRFRDFSLRRSVLHKPCCACALWSGGGVGGGLRDIGQSGQHRPPLAAVARRGFGDRFRRGRTQRLLPCNWEFSEAALWRDAQQQASRSRDSPRTFIGRPLEGAWGLTELRKEVGRRQHCQRGPRRLMISLPRACADDCLLSPLPGCC